MSLTIEIEEKSVEPVTVCVTSLLIGQTFVTENLSTYGVRTRDGWVTFYDDGYHNQINSFKNGDEKLYTGLKKVIARPFDINIVISR